MSDMKDHVPDLKRCKRLRDKGFPQGMPFFWWSTLPWGDVDVVSDYAGLRGSIIAAAPIATELIGEIKKILEVPTGDAEGDSMLIAHLFEGSCSVYVPTQTLKRIARHADTLPNALADLWIWLKERGK